ncbi:hypothetical protein [Limnofasciculus baicalensis]|uniref:Uncharacterized protein n=1 Tax=Limnofasciculus baicalensis BBK-W-15 TaxID=2699891 RepID=A0AAE3GTL8_9CYAN|nr:hypothetical protein [Limnofasciculus baicalensis]MCP2730104.1 hypothetical protein [Limnofasciculus baicalensis BBK-W-15]
MTQEKDLQSLIADIDSILPKLRSRLPWSGAGEAGRQVLERVRSYLVSIEQNLGTTAQIPTNTPPTHPSVVQQIRQAVNQEVQSLRAGVTGSLQAELVALRQERDAIVQEIRQLENTRRESLDRIAQDVISRSSETLTQQLAQILVAWEAQQGREEATTEATPNRGVTLIPPQERLEQMRQTELQFDRMLINLDTNQRAIFDALQRNLYTYQNSLSQELDKMHRLGIQGEVLFTTLVNRLSQLSQQQGATTLASSSQLSDGTQTAPIATNPIPSQTQPPLDTLEVTGQIANKDNLGVDPLTLTPQPNPLSGTDRSVTLSLDTIYQDATVTPNRISEIPDLIPVILKPTADDPALENLISQDWEPIEEIETDNLDESEKTDTFIQLDITPPESLPTVESSNTINPPENPSVDFMFEPGAEVFPEASSLSGWQTEVNELQLGIEPWDRDINNLYDNLFNTENFSDPANLNEYDFDLANQIEFDDLETSVDETDFTTPTDDFTLSNPIFYEDRDFQFGGVTDLPVPIESTPLVPLVEPMADEHESWQVVSFDDSVFETAPELRSSLVGESQYSPETARESEDVETVRALTDLLDEMGLGDDRGESVAGALLHRETPQTFTTREEQWSIEERFDSQAPTPTIDDTYIAASPDEDLLAIDELTGNYEQEISLEEDILDQLSEDLNSFEEVQTQDITNPDEQPLLDPYWESPTVTPTETTDLASLPNQAFSTSEELLAEDWEEFAFQDFSEDDFSFPNWENGTTTSDLVFPETDTSTSQLANLDREVSDAEFVEDFDIIPTTPESFELDADFFSNGFLDFGTEYVVEDDIMLEEPLPLIEDEDA